MMAIVWVVKDILVGVVVIVRGGRGGGGDGGEADAGLVGVDVNDVGGVSSNDAVCGGQVMAVDDGDTGDNGSDVGDYDGGDDGDSGGCGAVVVKVVTYIAHNRDTDEYCARESTHLVWFDAVKGVPNKCLTSWLIQEGWQALQGPNHFFRQTIHFISVCLRQYVHNFLHTSTRGSPKKRCQGG